MKHISIVAYITTAGESLTPYIVTSQDSELLRKRLIRRSVWMGVDLVLKQWSKSYPDAILFLEHVNTIFVPYLTELRGREEFEAHGVVLLMDNCSNHTPDDVIAVLTISFYGSRSRNVMHSCMKCLNFPQKSLTLVVFIASDNSNEIQFKASRYRGVLSPDWVGQICTNGITTRSMKYCPVK
jgi:hypothetical protein